MSIFTLETPLDIKEIPADIGFIDVPIEEKVKLSILHDLVNLNWTVESKLGKITITPPPTYDKTMIRDAMSVRRIELIKKNEQWIRCHLKIARQNLANGSVCLKSKISPEIEVCETEKQHSLFRIFRYYWSSPHSEYVGRRIKLIVRDGALPSRPVIGIAALGSPIIHIPERDNFIGWNKEIRTSNLIYAMDAYIIGALPPYNYLLGGKLISYLLVSNEVRKIFKKKYANQTTIIKHRKCKDLVCIFTTGLYGKSSQYNRLQYDNRVLYQPIGYTKGFGTLHLSEATFDLMKELVNKKNIKIGNKFGDGPIWKMRLIQSVGDSLGFDSDFLLRHSFARSIYYIPLAENSLQFLNRMDAKPKYFNYSLDSLAGYWRARWLTSRKIQPDVIKNVLSFNPNQFSIK